MDNHPRSIAQGIATYLLLEDSRSFNEIGFYTKMIVDNLILSHKKQGLDLVAFQDCLHDSENKIWEYESKWDLVTDEKVQAHVSDIISKTISKIEKESPVFILAQNISIYLLTNDKPELSKEYVHTINKSANWLVAAHLIEGLDLEDILSHFEPHNGSEIIYS